MLMDRKQRSLPLMGDSGMNVDGYRRGRWIFLGDGGI